MLLGTLGGSSLENMLVRKRMLRAGYRKGMERDGYGN